jgi:hypothetical protein
MDMVLRDNPIWKWGVENLEINILALCRSEEFETVEQLGVETLAGYPPCAMEGFRVSPIY